ncbi:glycerol-3-phosphate 1-O-acyltransferase PlsY [Trichlorobacter ammonificans]|uniref:Glycerol-3-phosphate acyltransferase n=1 Tax=Trichlorobacter ammonificans TaxID=2916410 RepID=A0ABN8HM23_9BACT|nr:glycerol-3-phosphate 1-O-acyltransferase PlsY [Trichlorobacter ammonificans]CAH2032386.1 Glycerol-3-phosphate acyltransferase [Trichlorobacter ammonificans]
MTTVLWIVGAYLLGSIPTGLLLGKLCGIDVRQEGSGNIGATNLYRTVGRRVGILTLIGDCLKGFLPVLLAWKLAGLGEPLQAWIGLAAFSGHVFSVFLLFKGGKGVATALGVYLALAPLAVLGALLVFLLLVALWRYVSLGSVVAAAVMPLLVWLRPHSRELLIATALISIIVIVKHHANISRLVAGTESKFRA